MLDNDDDDDDEPGALSGMNGKGNRSTRRKFALMPFCLPQIPHELDWARIRVSAVGSWLLSELRHGSSCATKRRIRILCKLFVGRLIGRVMWNYGVSKYEDSGEVALDWTAQFHYQTVCIISSINVQQIRPDCLQNAHLHRKWQCIMKVKNVLCTAVRLWPIDHCAKDCDTVITSLELGAHRLQV
jgi:hypothetical protein